jgi:hypothetical protein
MKNLINHLKEEWYKYLLEIIVITAGILGAFALNNWNEDRLEREMELVILNEMQSEVQNNLDLIIEVINSHEQSLEELQYVLEAFSDPTGKINYVDLDIKVRSVVTRSLWSYDPQLGNLKSIISSGQINYIQNKELVILLSAFEGKVQDATEAVEMLKEIWVNEMGPIFSKYTLHGGQTLFGIQSSFQKDYDGFFNDRHLEFWYRHNGSWTKNELPEYYDVKTDMERMLEIIQKELDN